MARLYWVGQSSSILAVTLLQWHPSRNYPASTDVSNDNSHWISWMVLAKSTAWHDPFQESAYIALGVLVNSKPCVTSFKPRLLEKGAAVASDLCSRILHIFNIDVESHLTS
jgi:hypothetical protein